MIKLRKYIVKSTLFALIIAGAPLYSYSQESPAIINYQAVARDGNGDELSGEVLDVTFSIFESVPIGTPTYVEFHEGVLTDPFGLFSLKIGDGIAASGSFDEVQWSAGTFINIGVDIGNGMIDLGTFELASVPYSLYSSRADSANYGADEDANPSNELQELVLDGNILTLSSDNSGTQIDLSAYNTDAQQLSIDTTDPQNINIGLDNSATLVFSIEDADADPANELQTIEKIDNEVTLSNGGGSFTDDVNDADADITNEIQSIEKVGATVTLSNGGGSFTDETDDADSDITNEIQTIEKDGNTVTLSNSGGSFTDEVDDADADITNEIQTIDKAGSTVTLSNNGGSFTDETNDADADATNEIQVLSKSGSTVNLSNSGGSFTDEVNDADFNPANELQTISKSGSTVTLSNSGGTYTDEVNDADFNPSNELQTISKSGTTVTLSNSGGTYTDEVDDADASPSNELISNVSYANGNNNLTITESGSDQSVDLSDLKEDQNWTLSGQNITNSNTGNVGINESSPTSTLHIMGSTALKVRVEGPSGTNYVLGEETVFIGTPDIGDVEVNLPLAANVPGRVYIIKKGDPSLFNDLKVHATGSDQIEGQSSYILGNVSGVYEQIMIVSDGLSDWWIISKD